MLKQKPRARWRFNLIPSRAGACDIKQRALVPTMQILTRIGLALAWFTGLASVVAAAGGDAVGRDIVRSSQVARFEHRCRAREHAGMAFRGRLLVLQRGRAA